MRKCPLFCPLSDGRGHCRTRGMVSQCEHQGDASRCKRGLGKLLSDADERWAALEQFQPAPDQINGLPGLLRCYIHNLESRCDPAGEVVEVTLLRDQNAQLQTKIVQLEKKEA